MTTIDFDFLNVYVKSKIPTHIFLRIVLTIFNFFAFFGLLWLAGSVAGQKEDPTPAFFLLPIIYFFIIGKYLLWNTFGEEFYIISSTHISFRHSYGLFKTNLKTSTYDFGGIDHPNEEYKENDLVHLVFIKYTPEKLEEQIFRTNIAIKYSDWVRFSNRLKEMRMDEYSEETNFPKIYAN